MKLNPPPTVITVFNDIWLKWIASLYESLSNKFFSFIIKTSAYTAGKETVVLVNTSGGSVTITLPPASKNEGLVLIIKDTDGGINTVTLDGNGSETIDGSATLVLSATRGTAMIMCDGANWHRLSN